VSISTTKAEYISIATIIREIIWLTFILHELHIPIGISKIYSDNLGVVQLVTNPIMHSRTKHFELDLHFVCDII